MLTCARLRWPIGASRTALELSRNKGSRAKAHRSAGDRDGLRLRSPILQAKCVGYHEVRPQSVETAQMAKRATPGCRGRLSKRVGLQNEAAKVRQLQRPRCENRTQFARHHGFRLMRAPARRAEPERLQGAAGKSTATLNHSRRFVGDCGDSPTPCRVALRRKLIGQISELVDLEVSTLAQQFAISPLHVLRPDSGWVVDLFAWAEI